jgi:hypothetical protein
MSDNISSTRGREGGGVDLVVMTYIKKNKTVQSFVYKLTRPNEVLQRQHKYKESTNKQTNKHNQNHCKAQDQTTAKHYN